MICVMLVSLSDTLLVSVWAVQRLPQDLMAKGALAALRLITEVWAIGVALSYLCYFVTGRAGGACFGCGYCRIACKGCVPAALQQA